MCVTTLDDGDVEGVLFVCQFQQHFEVGLNAACLFCLKNLHMHGCQLQPSEVQDRFDACRDQVLLVAIVVM